MAGVESGECESERGAVMKHEMPVRTLIGIIFIGAIFAAPFLGFIYQCIVSQMNPVHRFIAVFVITIIVVVWDWRNALQEEKRK